MIYTVINTTIENEKEAYQKSISKTPADNERFHASGGVCPHTVLCEFGSVSPARTFVNPRLREAATTLWAILLRMSRVTIRR